MSKRASIEDIVNFLKRRRQAETTSIREDQPQVQSGGSLSQRRDWVDGETGGSQLGEDEEQQIGEDAIEAPEDVEHPCLPELTTQSCEPLPGYFSCFKITPQGYCNDIYSFFHNSIPLLTEKLISEMVNGRSIKFQTRIQVKYTRGIMWDVMEMEYYINCWQKTVTNQNDIDQKLQEALQDSIDKHEGFEARGSGWSINQIICMNMHITNFRPIRGSTYIPTPPKLANKKALINVKNENDPYCFLYSILAQLYPAKSHLNNIYSYHKHFNKINYEGIGFPVTLAGVRKFEDQNPTISCNVFGYYNEEVRPLLITKHKNRRHCNLLLLEQDEVQHYVCIKSLSRLLAHETGHKAIKFFCNYCLGHYNTQERFNNHYCIDSTQLVEMPKRGENFLYFKQASKLLHHPFVIYADTESIIAPKDTVQPCPDQSFTVAEDEHIPCGAAYVTISKCCNNKQPKIGQVWLSRSEHCIKLFLQQIEKEAEEYQNRIDNIVPLNWSTMDWSHFHSTSDCFVCQNEFQICNDCKNKRFISDLCDNCKKERRIDHCHMCGDYRQPLHNQCNLQFCCSRDVPVVLHNAKCYDLHLILRTMANCKEKDLKFYDIDCISKGGEKFATVSLKYKHKTPSGKRVFYSIRFLDSFQFLDTSLSKLVENLAKDGKERFLAMRSGFRDYSNDDLDLILSKGIYPYNYITSTDKFLEDHLPPKQFYHNRLTGDDISNDDYSLAQTVFNRFNCQNLGDLHDHYLTTDVLLLADVFEAFRSSILDKHHLDPIHFITLPSLGWQALFRKTKQKLELFVDQDMYNWMEGSIRGGICSLNHRLATANNPYLPDTFNPSEPISYILPLDANNLYGGCMRSYLPIGDFKWVDTDIGVMMVDDDGEFGYFLEVDLIYPSHLHSSHSDMPLAPEKLQITETMLSPYCRRLVEKLNIKGFGMKKMCPSLYLKERYVVHYRNLKYYLQKGLELLKIHRVLRFRQAPWMCPYIDMNTQLRQLASSDFEKALWKLLNNAVYGKSMEDVR